MLPIVMKNICTVFGLGYFTKMPGTLGSIAGAFLGFILLSFYPIQLVLFFFLGLPVKIEQPSLRFHLLSSQLRF